MLEEMVNLLRVNLAFLYNICNTILNKKTSLMVLLVTLKSVISVCMVFCGGAATSAPTQSILLVHLAHTLQMIFGKFKGRQQQCEEGTAIGG